MATEEPPKKRSVSPKRFGANRIICPTCEKTVYPMEAIKFENATYHQSCFKCSHCNGKLSLSNVALVSGKLFCIPHFKELFSEGGGRYSFVGKVLNEEDFKKLQLSNETTLTNQPDTITATTTETTPAATTNPAPEEVTGSASEAKQRYAEMLASQIPVSSSQKPIVGSSANPKKKFGAGANRLVCPKCNKTVYAMEAIKFENVTYHQSCFKCTHCNGKLSLSNVALVSEKLFCKPHFKELFSEGGGRYSFVGKMIDSEALGQEVENDNSDPVV